jgi:NAD(P)-dependent dehydrogenase (short-subunit alcohol dehydrogenase family)
MALVKRISVFLKCQSRRPRISRGPVSLDVTNEVQAKAAIDAAIAHFGGLDVLVNNAGYGNVSPVEDTLLDDFRAQIETTLFGVIIMTKAVLPYFRERKAGHIIQVTSIAGRLGPIGRAPYAAAKFGVEGFSESLSKEIGPLGHPYSYRKAAIGSIRIARVADG